MYVYKVYFSFTSTFPKFLHTFYIQSTFKSSGIEVEDASNAYVTSYSFTPSFLRDEISEVATAKTMAFKQTGYFYLVTAKPVTLPKQIDKIKIERYEQVDPAVEFSQHGTISNRAVFTKEVIKRQDKNVHAIKIGDKYFILVCGQGCTYIPAFQYDNDTSAEYIESLYGYKLRNKPLYQYPPPTMCTTNLLTLLTLPEESMSFEARCGQVKQQQQTYHIERQHRVRRGKGRGRPRRKHY